MFSVSLVGDPKSFLGTRNETKYFPGKLHLPRMKEGCTLTKGMLDQGNCLVAVRNWLGLRPHRIGPYH